MTNPRQGRNDAATLATILLGGVAFLAGIGIAMKVQAASVAAVFLAGGTLLLFFPIYWTFGRKTQEDRIRKEARSRSDGRAHGKRRGRGGILIRLLPPPPGSAARRADYLKILFLSGIFAAAAIFSYTMGEWGLGGFFLFVCLLFFFFWSANR